MAQKQHLDERGERIHFGAAHSAEAALLSEELSVEDQMEVSVTEGLH